MKFDRRTRRLGAAALSLTVLGAAAVTLRADPARAAGIISAVTTVSCSVTGTNWCISGNNSSSGIGVIGTSKSGTGLSGTSTSQYGVKATSVSGTALLAQTTSGASAISATAGNGAAIVATTKSSSESSSVISATASSGGSAITASTAGGYTAISGTAAGNGNGSVSSTGVYGQGYYGVVGYSNTNNIGVYGSTSTDTGTGVYGDSSSGEGVEGQTYSGDGVYGFASTGTGIDGRSGVGYGGYFASQDGYGVFSNTTGGVAFVGRNSSGNASDIQGSNIGLLGRSPAAGYPLVLTDATPNTLFQVDGYGNVSYTGSLTHVGSINGGGKARSFSAVATQPTVEDSGTAQLVSGVAVVRLDPTFAASIDLSTAYRVFLTPAGDTRGLYVANRTAAGFVVRESQAGHSTVAFDYRILATALGQSGQRMARINAVTDTSLVKAPLPVLPAATVPRPHTIPALHAVKP